MKRLTPEERFQIVQIYYKNNCSVRSTFRALRPIFGRHKRPSESVIRKTVCRFRTTLTVEDKVPCQRRRTVCTQDVIAAVEQSIAEDPNESIRQRAQQLKMCPSTLWRILRKDLGLRALKESKMADTEIKRKGRPKKRESEADAPAKSPPKKAALSNGDDSPVPAKRGRGRPPKAVTKASKKPPPVPGRGRGRPPSKPAPAAASKKKETSEDEDEEEEEEEEEKKESSPEADSS